MKNLPFIEKIEAIKREHRILIFAGLILLISGLYLYLFYLPKKDEIKRVRTELSRLTRELNEAKQKARNLPKFEAEAAVIEAKFKEVSRLLPDKKEIPSLLKQINRLGKESRLQFLLFKPLKERSKGFYFEIPISIKVRGRYYDVLSFFDKISNMPRIVNIFDVKMHPAKSKGYEIDTTFTAVTYRFRGKNEKDVSKRKKRKRR